MKQFAQARLATIVALLGFALILASNHCALGGMTVAPGSEDHSCCRENGQPATVIECCTSLHAALTVNLSAPATPLFVLHPLWDDSASIMEISASGPVGLDAFAVAGPPGAASFAEIVLNSSLLAHAPPLFVV